MKIVLQRYQQDICHYLYSLQQANIYCNVVIATRDGLDLIPAHSIVLFASQSPVLQGILQGAVGKQHFVINDFENESACVLRSMVKSLYTGEVEFTTETIEPLKCLYKRLLLHKFVAFCEEASNVVSSINLQNFVSDANGANFLGYKPGRNLTTFGKNAQNIVEKHQDCDDLSGTTFQQADEKKMFVLSTNENEHTEIMKTLKGNGKRKQSELESLANLSKRKTVPEVTEMSVLSRQTLNNPKRSSSETKNTKTKKAGGNILPNNRNVKSKNTKVKNKTGADPEDDQDTNSMLCDPNDAETEKDTTSCSDVNSGDGNMKPNKQEEIFLDVRENPRETTSDDIVSGDLEEKLEGNKSFADVTDISQKMEGEKRCNTIEPKATKAHTVGWQNIKTNSVVPVEPGITTMVSVDSSSTNDIPKKVTGKRVKQICAHCDNPVKVCICPIGPKGFKRKCPGCPLRFLDQAQWYKHCKSTHSVWCVECDSHNVTEVRVAQHMYVMHKRMLNEEKYPILKCDVKV